ncbi:hypothetical protein BW893_30270, partial [Bacillus wiedmannii]
HGAELPRQPLGAWTGFHADASGRHIDEEGNDPAAIELGLLDWRACGVQPDQVEPALAQIDAVGHGDLVDVAHDGLLGRWDLEHTPEVRGGPSH